MKKISLLQANKHINLVYRMRAIDADFDFDLFIIIQSVHLDSYASGPHLCPSCYNGEIQP